MDRFARTVVATAAASLAALGTAAAVSAAPGDGAVVFPTTCDVVLPGGGSAEGPGQLVLLPDGGTVVRCKVDFASGAAPATPVKSGSPGCKSIVTPGGTVVAPCPKP